MTTPRKHTRARLSTLTIGVVALAGTTLAACGSDSPSDPTAESTAPGDTTVKPEIDPGDGGNYAPQLDPADFVSGIDHPFFPLTPGSKWIYEDEGVRDEFTVTSDTKTIAGIEAVVVHDTAYENGEVVEDTLDWFAQDKDGNVWYLGEDTAEYENGKVTSRAGSWEHGVDGAYAGIVMPAEPTVGLAQRQEFYSGEAEDMGEVIQLDGTATTPLGEYSDLLVVKEWSPLEPDVVEHKYYARGIGMVLAEKVQGGDGREALVEYTAG